MPSLIYKNDIGARIIIDTENHTIPVTTDLTILMRKPDGTSVILTPPGGGIDYATGIITYTTVSGDINASGRYSVQVHGVFDDGDDLKSNVASFMVYEPVG